MFEFGAFDWLVHWALSVDFVECLGGGYGALCLLLGCVCSWWENSTLLVVCGLSCDWCQFARVFCGLLAGICY